MDQRDTPIWEKCVSSCFFSILVRMGYESVSAIIVALIIVTLWFGWLPKRTVNSMKDMLEHREDKYSPSLHFVDERSGLFLCDNTGRLTKGVGMRSAAPRRTYTPEYVAHIRSLRHAAIRRRRLIAATLLMLTIVTLVVAAFAVIAWWFALIPSVLLLAVLGCGMNVARQARVWEARVAKYRALQSSVERVSIPAMSVVQESLHAVDESAVINCDDVATSVMQQKEIRQAVERCGGAEAHQTVIVDNTGTVDSDYGSQDLISFSLGSSESFWRHEVPVSAPESLAIKSTKQVVKAVAVSGPSLKHEEESSVDVQPSMVESSTSVETPVSTGQSAEEVIRDIEAPTSSQDSLGVADLKEVLARRSA